MLKMFFEFDDDFEGSLQPISPERVMAKHAKPRSTELYKSLGFMEKRYLMEQGYIIQPSDCPSVVAVNKYGYMFRSPGCISVEVLKEPLFRKEYGDDYAAHGSNKITGDKLNFTDSGYVASWIGNSEFIKIHTGIHVYVPVGYGLFQGPIPYSEGEQDFAVMSGIEYANSRGESSIKENPYFVVEVNFIAKANDGVTKYSIERGQSVGIIYPVLKPSRFSLDQLNKFEL